MSITNNFIFVAARAFGRLLRFGLFRGVSKFYLAAFTALLCSGCDVSADNGPSTNAKNETGLSSEQLSQLEEIIISRNWHDIYLLGTPL